MATGVSFSTQRVTKVKSIVQDEIAAHFMASLGQEQDILNIVSAQIYKESSFDASVIKGPVSYRPGTSGFAYFNSAVMQSLSLRGDPGEVARSFQGVYAIGIMQVMGWNFVRGASPTGRCELERLRPDLAGELTVAPGEDIYSLILGEANLPLAIRAGLTILEGKYKAVNYTPEGYRVRGDLFNRLFPSKMAGALAGYLGLGASDSNGTTPQGYAATILGGPAYQKANGNGLSAKDSKINIASNQGPSTNGTGQKPIGVAGCA